MTDLPILRMSPHLTPRPWGGDRLGTVLHKPLPGDEPIGESWELSDHTDGPSSIAGGPFDGRLFGEVLREFPDEMVGSNDPTGPYPLLVKYIDAREDLSIQVHPDDDYTARVGIADRGKSECWFILDCAGGTEVIYGLKEGITRSDLIMAIESKTVPDCIRRIPIEPRDFLFVPPGTVHAILGETLLCEIQQSSNTTFRLWDWNRKPERPLHIKESLEVIRFESSKAEPPFHLEPLSDASPLVTVLTDNEYFLVRAVQLPPESSLYLTHSGKGAILNGVEGAGEINELGMALGETFFVPACIPQFCVRTGHSPVTVLVSESNE